jgi:hypothetical protein
MNTSADAFARFAAKMANHRLFESKTEKYDPATCGQDEGSKRGQ